MRTCVQKLKPKMELVSFSLFLLFLSAATSVPKYRILTSI